MSFESDVQRRTLGFVAPGRDTVALLAAALDADPYSEFESEAEVGETLKDLEAVGLATTDGETWSVTQAGLEALQS